MPVPVSEILHYCDLYEVVDRRFFAEIINRIDDGYVSFVNEYNRAKILKAHESQRQKQFNRGR